MTSRDPFGTPEPAGAAGASVTTFPAYRDHVNSNPDLQDYFDDSGIPPPHRFSGIYSQHSLSRGSTPVPSASTPSTLNTPDANARGLYSSPAAAAFAAAESTRDLPATAPLQPRDMSTYNNIEAPNQWMEKPPSRSNRSKWIVIASIVGLLALIGVGVGVGVSLSQKNKSGSSRASSSSSSNSSSVTQSDPNDPSSFTKDSRLKQSFYGLAYTPAGSQLPDCGNNISDIITDVQLMSQLTTRIRLYGADCNQSALVLDAIQRTKVNLTVWLGNYPVPTNESVYTRQRDLILDALQTYGTDHVGGVTVGNEFMLNYLSANGGGDDPNSSIGNTGAAILIGNIQDTISKIDALSLDKHIPVGTADAGSYFNTEVLEAVEYGMSNVHPWFANVSVETAAGWTAEFFDTWNLEPAAKLSNTPKMYIAETGWPTKSSDVSNESNGPSTASEANLQTFLDTFVCQANTNGTGYFFFEFFDEQWKDAEFGGVEGWWGLFNANKTLKNIEIPSC